MQIEWKSIGGRELAGKRLPVLKGCQKRETLVMANPLRESLASGDGVRYRLVDFYSYG